MNAIRLLLISLFVVAVGTTSEVQAATYYFHTDHLGTPQALTDVNQQVVWQGDQEPFGENNPAVNLVEQNLRFPGQYFDVETGLDYNYFRSYDPQIGRYTQPDPIGLRAGLNPYKYASANPITSSDRYGLIDSVTAACANPANAATCAAAGIGNTAQAGVGATAGVGIWCLLTGNCDANEEGDSGADAEAATCPQLPEDFQGTDPQLGKGRTNTNAPEDETAEEMFERLTGGTGGKQMEGKPEGQVRGENGVIYRPPTDTKPARIDIPARGKRPHEAVHWD